MHWIENEHIALNFCAFIGFLPEHDAWNKAFVELGAKEKLVKSLIRSCEVSQMCVMVFHTPILHLPFFDVHIIALDSA